jgi:hypothetical protein
MTEPAPINPNNVSQTRTAARQVPEQSSYSRQTANGHDSITYTVKKGDTLGRIRQGAAVFAKSQGLELCADQTVANIAHQSRTCDPSNPDKLSVNDQIVIYVKSRQATAEKTQTPAVHQGNKHTGHDHQDVVTISAKAATSAAGQGDLKSFLSSLKAKYDGKLKGNPELQAKFLAEVNSYVNEHFMAGYEGGKQLNIDDDFVLTADNFSHLTVGIDPKDGQAKIKADCGLFAQAYELCFRSAGLKTSYTGSFVNLGAVRGGHAQVAGFLPGDDFMIMNNNARAERFSLAYSKDNGRAVAQQMLKHDFGARVTIYGSLPGVRKQSEIASRLVKQAVRYETMANLENGLRSYNKYASGLEMIKNAGSKDEFLAAVSAYKARTGDTLRQLGFTLEEQTKNVLASYMNETDKMEGLLADVKELKGHLNPKKDYPITLKLDQTEKAFKSVKELDNFISEKTDELANYKQEITRSLSLFA